MKARRAACLAALWGFAAVGAWAASALRFELRETLGERGAGRNELEEPVDVALGSAGEIVALDRTRGALVVFASSGRWRETLGDPWPGTPDSELDDPRGLAVDRRGRYWVVDSGNHRLAILGRDGRLERVVGGLGAQTGRFRHPADVAFDRRGRAYVADLGNDRVQVFRPDGTFEASWERRSKNRREHLAKPLSLAYSDWGEGSLWVVNQGSSRIERFELEQGEWLEGLDVAAVVSGPVRLERLEIEPTFHRMFLADSAGDRVIVLSRRGVLEGEIRSEERGSIRPKGVAVSRTLDVFVADANGPRVVWFQKQ